MSEKKLKPSLRENKRYLLLETSAKKQEIEQAILDFIGVLGYAKSGLHFIRSNIIAVNRESVNEIRAALCLYPKIIKVKRISGTIKGLKAKF